MPVHLMRGRKWLPEHSGERSIAWLVWIVWAALLLIALVTVLRYARNIPIAEDWQFVPALTGHEQDLWKWLWGQNNEHRVPFPKAVLLLLLMASGGDFRSGMVATTISMGAMAAAMIWAARRIRGHTKLSDVFFPATLLHLGHRDSLSFNWQFTFVTPALLACVFLLLIVVYGDRPTARAAVVAGICLVLLPLSGLNGLVMVVPMSLWLLLVAVPLLRRPACDPQLARWVTPFLVGSVGVASVLSAYYLHDFERPSWSPPNPGVKPSLELAGRLLALAFGPAASISWKLSFAGASAVLLATATLLIVRGVLHREARDGKRLLGLLLLSASIGILTFGVAWGRAGWVPQVGIPMRYVIVAMPLLCCAYYAWLLFGPPKIRDGAGGACGCDVRADSAQ